MSKLKMQASSTRIMADDDLCAAKEIPIEDAIGHEEWSDHPNSTGRRYYFSNTEGAPASELFFVGVNPKSKFFGPDGRCEIYGDVKIYDEDGTIYVLYPTDSDHTQTLTPQHNLLSLNIPVQCLLSTTWSHMSYCLMNKADNNDCIIQNKELRFDKLTDINESHKLREMRDENVYVSYAAFPAAVVAILDITLYKRNNDSAPDPAPLNLSGRIITRCGNTYGHEYPGIVLLNTRPDESIELTCNGPIKIYRDEVVVPAYSFLRIDLRLSLPRREEFHCRADFFAKQQVTIIEDFETEDFDVQFKVTWCHPYQLQNSTKVSATQDELDVINSKPSPLTNKGYSLVEVFTVMVHQDVDSELKILGSMSIDDNLSSFYLFNKKNEYNPFEVSGGNGNTIPINVTRRCFLMSGCLGMGLDLRDVEGQVRIKGYLKWNDQNVENPLSWYDKRICSIFKGLHGYAAVYYTIFSNACQAEVSILFKCDKYPNDSHCVGGSVLARHTKERYSTVHDSTFYQSVLIRDKPSLLKSGDKLPLLKSVVAVPIDASLRLAIDLFATPLSIVLPEESLKLELELELEVPINMGSVTHPIKGTNYSIEVTVTWSDFHKIVIEERDKKDQSKRNLCNVL